MLSLLWTPAGVVQQALAEVRELHRRVDALERRCSTPAETEDVLRYVAALRNAYLVGSEDRKHQETERLLASYWRLERAVRDGAPQGGAGPGWARHGRIGVRDRSD